MHTSPVINRPRTKLWQFTIANLLVAITLVAATCGAFRFDIALGVYALHLTIAIAIAAIRVRVSIWYHEELWDALEVPNSVRQMEGVYLAINSLGVAIAAVFLFYVGIGAALVLLVVGFEILLEGVRETALLRATLGGISVLAVLGTGIIFSVGWLHWMWPRPYFTRTASPSSPSDETA